MERLTVDCSEYCAGKLLRHQHVKTSIWN